MLKFLAVLGSILEMLLSMIQKSQRQKEYKDAQAKADMAAADPAGTFKRMFSGKSEPGSKTSDSNP